MVGIGDVGLKPRASDVDVLKNDRSGTPGARSVSSASRGRDLRVLSSFERIHLRAWRRDGGQAVERGLPDDTGLFETTGLEGVPDEALAKSGL